MLSPVDPIGSGPYQVDSVEPERVRLVAFPEYWGEKANIPNFEVQYIVDTSARTFAILGGTVDMILAPAGPGAINAIMQQNPQPAHGCRPAGQLLLDPLQHDQEALR